MNDGQKIKVEHVSVNKGGKSTGAKTKQGIKNIKKANLKNGFYTKEAIEEGKLFKKMIKEEIDFLQEFNSKF